MLFILSAGQKISIHALCEEGDPLLVAAQHDGVISIHALCEEGDCRRSKVCGVPRPISIHALCEEGDGSPDRSDSRPRYFYPRPLRGGRLQLGCISQSLAVISIHALCEEGDRCCPASMQSARRFLSTPSARRATVVAVVYIVA